MSSHRELIVWQRAMELVPMVYVVARRLPTEERFALADQLRRAAISIPANIAEGQARQHMGEFIQMLSIARGSLAEVDTLLLISVELGYASAEDVVKAQNLVYSIRQLLQRLINHLRMSRGTMLATTQRATPNAKRRT